MHKPGTLGLKKFGLGKLQFEKLWAQYINYELTTDIFTGVTARNTYASKKRKMHLRSDELQ